MKLRFLIILVVLISGCVATTLKITDIQMTNGVTMENLPIDSVTGFSPDDEAIYSWFSYSRAPPNTIIKGIWYYEGQFLADSLVELKESSGAGHFKISRTTEKLFTAGNYRLDISFRDKVLKSISFSVQ